ncbi:cyclin-dependent kinase inhibitor [Trema orientale]|uniref:Cyclin-dependent kinase inhibitor n=1 Tax=Trema orientale TaxID=63057 RepID=A0A2P5D692_TREOI|nr:cyclin-dependent kinase inhibitor [Trema orientale]
MDMEIVSSTTAADHDAIAIAVEDYQAGCSTPTRPEHRIPARSLPPPPPKKKKRSPFAAGKKRVMPKNGYFNPPDLEELFAMAPRPGPGPAWRLLHA